MFLHVADAVDEGLQNVTIRNVDTAVVVLAVTFVKQLPIQELWISFGTRRSFKYIASHFCLCMILYRFYRIIFVYLCVLTLSAYLS